MKDVETIWQQLQVSQASRALSLFAEAGIPCMLLKGGAAIAAGWLRPGARALTDVDVLVPPSRLAEAVAILTKHDWLPTRTPSVPDARRHSQPIRSPWGILLDLHWYALRHARWLGVDDVLWEGSQRFRLAGVDVLVPSPEDFLVHTVAHGLRRASDGANWREDVRALLRGRSTRLDWVRVIKTSANYRVSPLVASALELIAEELPSEIPKQVSKDLCRTPLHRTDRLFLQLTTDHLDEAGFRQALVVVLDYWRTRPARWFRMPLGFIDFLKDRWELSSRAAVLKEIGAVAVWGLQSEFRRMRGVPAFKNDRLSGG